MAQAVEVPGYFFVRSPDRAVEYPTSDELIFAFRSVADFFPSGEYFVYGSVGRALVTSVDLRNSSSGKILDSHKLQLRHNPLGVLDIDVAVSERAMPWDEITSFSKRVYETTGRKIVVDPHLFWEGIDNETGEEKITLFLSHPPMILPRFWIETVNVRVNGVTLPVLHSRGQLLTKCAPKSFRDKDLSEIFGLLVYIRNHDDLIGEEELKFCFQQVESYLKHSPNILLRDILRLLYYALPRELRVKINFRKRFGINPPKNPPTMFAHDSIEPFYF